jgi:hypothetical protein
MNFNPKISYLLTGLLLTISLAACSGPAPTNQAPDAMKQGDAMKEGGAMKQGDAMKTP